MYKQNGFSLMTKIGKITNDQMQQANPTSTVIIPKFLSVWQDLHFIFYMFALLRKWIEAGQESTDNWCVL